VVEIRWRSVEVVGLLCPLYHLLSCSSSSISSSQLTSHLSLSSHSWPRSQQHRHLITHHLVSFKLLPRLQSFSHRHIDPESLAADLTFASPSRDRIHRLPLPSPTLIPFIISSWALPSPPLRMNHTVMLTPMAPSTTATLIHTVEVVMLTPPQRLLAPSSTLLPL
jgi:hypothetical protein